MIHKFSKKIGAIFLSLLMVLSIICIKEYPVFAQEGALVVYRGHQQTYGNLSPAADGAVLGTTGKAKRLEAIQISKGPALSNIPGDIQYQVHVQSFGNSNWIGQGQLAGTTGKAKRIESIRIRLTGELANQYDVYYSTHCQKLGWTRWVKGLKNADTAGGWCGTQGQSLRVEAIRVKIVPINQGAPDNTGSCSFYSSQSDNKLTYSGHQQTYGNLSAVNEGQILGITGKSKRLEAIGISLNDSAKLSPSDGITYRTHVQSYGWQNWKSNGDLSGTTGESKRIEAIQIKLTGSISNSYDVWYRVHSQTFGWMGWAKNGESAGTTGISRRVEAIQIRIVPKGLAAPGSTTNAYTDKLPLVSNGKMIALTFDDGPGARCGELLNCLEANNAHATFFVAGEPAGIHKDYLTRMKQIGCEVGNHTANHKILSRLSASAISSEMEGVNSILRSTLGGNATIMRPPGGGCNATVQNTVGVPIILWSIDTLDWKTRNTQMTINCVLNNAKDGDIILMHDIHSPSVDAALYLIPELKRRGYQLVTVSELAQAKGITLQPGQVYHSIR